MKVGDTKNGLTILWMDNVSELVPDPLVKVGTKVFQETEEYAYIFSLELEKQLISYKNTHFIRLSQF